jgi:non-ribosomal peptide synthetase component E (peptide arylation enzyme)
LQLSDRGELESETILLTHLHVVRAAGIRVPDVRLDQRDCVVSRRADLTLEVLLRMFAASGVAKQQWPGQVEFFDALPLSAAGKVNKDRVWAEVAGRQGGSP